MFCHGTNLYNRYGGGMKWGKQRGGQIGRGKHGHGNQGYSQDIKLQAKEEANATYNDIG
jgi:hypothetical protein